MEMSAESVHNEIAYFLETLGRQKFALDRQFRRLRSSPSNENVHALRLTIRRLGAQLWLVQQERKKLLPKRLMRSLELVNQDLGQYREVSVAIKDCESYGRKTKRLEAQGSKAKRVLLKGLTRKRQRKLLLKVDVLERRLQGFSKLDFSKGKSLLGRKLQLLLHKSALKDEEMHKVRILTKKTRDCMECLGLPVTGLPDLQAHLGRGHDLEVLQGLVRRNKLIQRDRQKEYQRARELVRPALRRALRQLGMGQRPKN